MRPSVVVLLAIPFSLAFAFLVMGYFGISANLMSLGGLAIALGLLVDGSVVMVENVDRMVRRDHSDESLIHVVAKACAEVARPIVFSLLIIVIVFLPLFTLQGVEGKTFRPLAQTMASAMLGSLIFAVTLVPVLCSMLMRRPCDGSEHREFFVLRWLIAVYRPVVSFFVRRPQAAVDELLTGTKAELTVKIFGPDMEVLKKKAAEIEALIRTVKGARDVQKDQVTGTPRLRITIDNIG